MSSVTPFLVWVTRKSGNSDDTDKGILNLTRTSPENEAVVVMLKLPKELRATPNKFTELVGKVETVVIPAESTSENIRDTPKPSPD
jgi:hypothetical protein